MYIIIAQLYGHKLELKFKLKLPNEIFDSHFRFMDVQLKIFVIISLLRPALVCKLFCNKIIATEYETYFALSQGNLPATRYPLPTTRCQQPAASWLWRPAQMQLTSFSWGKKWALYTDKTPSEWKLCARCICRRSSRWKSPINAART